MPSPVHPRDTAATGDGATSQGRKNDTPRPEVTRDSSRPVTDTGAQVERFPDWQPRTAPRTWGNP